MKAQIQNMNPILANEMLKSNRGNRKLRKETVSFYASQMLNGEWKENGEPFIVDCNGQIKDGQHRLHAVIKANHSYNVPIITGVNPSVMDTIDTGANRSLSDILNLNDFKDANATASLVKRILKWQRNVNPLRQGGDEGATKMSNLKGLEYAQENAGMLKTIILTLKPLYLKSNKAFTLTEVAFVLYIISNDGQKITDTTVEFCKQLLAIATVEGNSADYIHRLKLNSKQSKSSLNSYWLLAVIIKGWNNYVTGDPVVRYIRWDLKSTFPNIIKI